MVDLDESTDIYKLRKYRKRKKYLDKILTFTILYSMSLNIYALMRRVAGHIYLREIIIRWEIIINGFVKITSEHNTRKPS